MRIAPRDACNDVAQIPRRLVWARRAMLVAWLSGTASVVLARLEARWYVFRLGRKKTIVLQRAFVGCLLGTAVGDALGLPYEGLSPRRARRLLGPPTQYRLLSNRGMVSDDTEHACMVAQSLIASGGDAERFGSELGRRLRLWVLAAPAGIGLASWPDAAAALGELDQIIAQIERGELPQRLRVEVLYAVTGPMQEVSLSSGWADEFLEVAERLDKAAEQVWGEPD